MKKIIDKLKMFWLAVLKNLPSSNMQIFKPLYRITSIEKNDNSDYEIVVQLIGKSVVFNMKPEEILADDKMTDQFSPRDIRTLTYLGYLDINSPKYKILAKNLSEKDNRILFTLYKKGDKKLHIKTASEISQSDEIIKNIGQQDAHMIGFVAASDAMLQEKSEKKNALKRLSSDNQKCVTQKD